MTEHLKDYLTRSGIAKNLDPIAIQGRDRLQQIVAANIPINIQTANGVLNDFIVSNDIEGIVYLYDESEGYYLLAPTTLFLLKTKLIAKPKTEKKLWRQKEQTPMTVIKELVTNDLITRSKDPGGFCEDMIGECTYSTLHTPDSTPNFRKLAEDGLISLDEEEAMEKWLVSMCRINKDKQEKIEHGRKVWELKYYESRGQNIQITDPALIDTRIRSLAAKNEYEDAIKLALQLPIHDSMRQISRVASAMLQSGQRSGAIETLCLMRSIAQKDNDARKNLLMYVDDHFFAGDIKGVKECLLAGGEDYINFRNNLGVSDDQLVQLLSFCYDNEDYGFQSINSNDIVDLIDDTREKKTIFETKKEENYKMRRYLTLVGARIFLFGEDGLKFPIKDEYYRSPSIAYYLTVKLGLYSKDKKREENFKEWLERLHKAGGSAEVGRAFNEIQAQSKKSRS